MRRLPWASCCSHVSTLSLLLQPRVYLGPHATASCLPWASCYCHVSALGECTQWWCSMTHGRSDWHGLQLTTIDHDNGAGPAVRACVSRGWRTSVWLAGRLAGPTSCQPDTGPAPIRSPPRALSACGCGSRGGSRGCCWLKDDDRLVTIPYWTVHGILLLPYFGIAMPQ